MNQITKVYSELVEFVHDHGWGLRHRWHSYKDGQYLPDKKVITIHPEIKNTKYGCMVLAHEIGHLIDATLGNYKNFYNHNGGPLTDKKLIDEAEWSAMIWSKTILKHFKLKHKFKELNRTWFKKHKLPLAIAIYG